jgi:RNA polymerase sigma-70 factor (ECF subfamily)
LSQEEFVRLLEKCRPALLIVASAVLGDRHEADDVVQEASLIGLASLDRFTPGTSFEGWMSQIVRNVGRNTSRKRARNPASPSGQEMIDARAGSTTHVPVGGEFRQLRDIPMTGDGRTANPAIFDASVHRAIMSLDEVSRVCLLLRAVGELSYAHIAAITDLNENTAMSHVFRSRRLLRERMSSHFGQTNPAEDDSR